MAKGKKHVIISIKPGGVIAARCATLGVATFENLREKHATLQRLDIEAKMIGISKTEWGGIKRESAKIAASSSHNLYVDILKQNIKQAIRTPSP